MEWALPRVPEADTAMMLALRKRGLDLAGFSQLPVHVYREIVRRGAHEGVNENEIVAWLWSAFELPVLRPADQ